VVQQTRHASNRIDDYFTVESGRLHTTGATQDLASLQQWLDSHHLKRVKVQKQGQKFLTSVGTNDVEKYTTKALNWAEGAGLAVVSLLFSVLLVVVVSIYMLLDMQRLAAAVDRRFPPAPGTTPLIERMERALASYVKGQAALSLIIGTSCGVGLWILGMIGLMPNGGHYALLFGAWAGITELIPYVGPWLGAAPPVLYALVQHPLSALWVALLFLAIQQLEGHVVVPKVMGHSLRLHPLLVIFGLLAGGEIYGFPGILVALPLLAAARAVWEFFSERLELASWTPEEPVADGVGLEVVPEKPARPLARGHSSRRRPSCCARVRWRAGTATSRRSRRPTSCSMPVRRLRSSGRTAPASRRCSRCSRARSSRAGERSTRTCRSGGCRSGRRSTGACPRARTSNSSRGSTGPRTQRPSRRAC
jgi:predicted PurR-regulated permease PerM